MRHGGLSVDGSGAGEGVTPITVYSLERASADALDYHNACSVNAGLNYVVGMLDAPPL